MRTENHRVKVLFVIPSLEAGGAQKVLAVLLKNLSKKKFDITLCVLTTTGEFYDDVPPSVTKINLNLPRVRFAPFKLYRVIRRINPDIVFVFDVNNLNLIVGVLSFFLPARMKFITREAVVLTSFFENYGYRWLRKTLYRWTFKRFDRIICQSEYMKNDLTVNFGVRGEVVSVINNPIESDLLRAQAESNERLLAPEVINLIAVGRIVFVKGYDLLIRAFSKVKLVNVHLTILGEKTPENPGYREEILKLIEDNNLTAKISFMGFNANPHKFVKESDLMVIASRTEAFSNAAIEANAVGTPVLAFNSPGGMAEIISHGYNGWLVENGNVDAMAVAIERSAQIQLDREEIMRYTTARYDVSQIIPLYERVMVGILPS